MTPPIRGVVETCLYTDDLPGLAAFYRERLGLRELSRDDRMAAFAVDERELLLMFRRGGTLRPIPTPGGEIPPHDGSGTTHLGLAISAGDLDAWRDHLKAGGVTIVSEVTWTRGGVSLYFHDPDGNLVELLTPGVWPVY